MVLYKIRDSSAFDEELTEKNEVRVRAYNGRAFDWREQIPVRGSTNGGADIKWHAKMTFPGRVCKQDVSWSGLRPWPLKCLQRVVILRGHGPLKLILLLSHTRINRIYNTQVLAPTISFNLRSNLDLTDQ